MNNTELNPTLFFETQADWEAWLAENHAQSKGIWLKLAKKGSDLDSVTLDQAQESGLCFGWIDSLAASIDETFWKIKFTPRRPRSKWSAVNRARVEILIAQGKMQPAGLLQVHMAQADGRWDGKIADK